MKTEKKRINTKSSENKKAEHNISITTFDINGINIQIKRLTE